MPEQADNNGTGSSTVYANQDFFFSTDKGTFKIWLTRLENALTKVVIHLYIENWLK
jgi:hypothetical protein